MHCLSGDNKSLELLNSIRKDPVTAYGMQKLCHTYFFKS